MITRQAIIDEARTWLGVVWRHQGRDRNGIDCGGLLIGVAKALGASDYDIGNYGKQPDAQNFLRHLEAWGGRRIPLGGALPGDVIAFRDGPFPCHCAIVTETGGVRHMIHADRRLKSVVEEPITREWLANRVAAYRFPGVADG